MEVLFYTSGADNFHFVRLVDSDTVEHAITDEISNYGRPEESRVHFHHFKIDTEAEAVVEKQLKLYEHYRDAPYPTWEMFFVQLCSIFRAESEPDLDTLTGTDWEVKI